MRRWLMTSSVAVLAFVAAAVMMGGGTRYGNGNLLVSNSLGLPSHGVVLVTVNSRLGIFGLLAHSLISGESPQGVSGNYLFLDLIASLKWVKKNIAAFGGDPDNLTIFGQSGGGLKVAALIASPLAKGLFQRAIIQSGGKHFEPTQLKEMGKYGNKFFARTGNPSVKGFVEWPAWDRAGDQYLYIAETLKVKSGYSDLTKIRPKRIGISL
jgi:carboxylesterase type B